MIIKDVILKEIKGIWGNPPVEGDLSTPVIKTNNMTYEGYIDYDDITYRSIPKKKLDSCYLKKGDLLVEKSGGTKTHSVGYVNIFDKENNVFVCNNFIVGLRPDNNIVLSEYLFFQMKFFYETGIFSDCYNKTTGIQNLQLQTYLSKSIVCPEKAEQEKVVATLNNIVKALANKNEQLKKLDELIQSKFYEMFGDPITNEKEWDVKTFGNLFNTILGKMLDKKKQIETDISLPYLGNANVQWGYFIFENLNTMTFTRKEIEKFNLQVGDLLICEGGESGRCAIWKGSSQEILFQKAIHRARVKNENEINPQFVAMLLKVLKFNGGLKKYVSQSTIEHLTGVKLSLVPIICPPFYLQQAFASYVEKVEEAKAIVNQEIAYLQELLDSRMDFYFRK